jgi:dipeptidyl aminopeptidase/acylaminoacyl peptidase
MEAHFVSNSTNNGRRSTVRRSLVGLVFFLAVCLMAGFDLASKAQAFPLLLISTQSPTPSPTSTPLVISSADSETMPTWTSTSTPRRATALAMTLQAQSELTQTRLPPTPSSIYTLTRTPTITTTYFYKVFPTVTLRKWPTYTFTPRPTYTSIPTQDRRETQDKIYHIQTATAQYYKQFTVTAEADNYILVADVSDTSHTIESSVVWTASPDMPLGVNTTWLPDGSGLLFEGNLYDRRKVYTLDLSGGEPVPLKGQNQQLLNENPPKNNKDNLQPALSPNGNWIAFSSLAVDDRSRHHIFIMKEDGSVLYQVTKGLYNEELQPSWSPDGKNIIFISVYGYYSAQIYKLSVSWLGDASHKPVDMYGKTALIPMTTINIESAPRYCMAADKPWIVFSAKVSTYPYARQLFLWKSDKDDIIQLTKDHGNSFPDWSSTCNKIIFMQDRGTPEIYTQNISWNDNPLVPSADGNPKLLIHNDGQAVSSPHFSPDDKRVVFVHKNHQ